MPWVKWHITPKGQLKNRLKDKDDKKIFVYSLELWEPRGLKDWGNWRTNIKKLRIDKLYCERSAEENHWDSAIESQLWKIEDKLIKEVDEIIKKLPELKKYWLDQSQEIPKLPKWFEGKILEYIELIYKKNSVYRILKDENKKERNQEIKNILQKNTLNLPSKEMLWFNFAEIESDEEYLISEFPIRIHPNNINTELLGLSMNWSTRNSQEKWYIEIYMPITPKYCIVINNVPWSRKYAIINTNINPTLKSWIEEAHNMIASNSIRYIWGRDETTVRKYAKLKQENRLYKSNQFIFKK